MEASLGCKRRREGQRGASSSKRQRRKKSARPDGEEVKWDLDLESDANGNRLPVDLSSEPHANEEFWVTGRDDGYFLELHQS